ncbi:LacI family DNA-binding transcriptional regulator, partial [Vibrio cholerae O1]|nr:LacI family DNA-binding transcriptional regulator [Vibrio cholerae O1]
MSQSALNFESQPYFSKKCSFLSRVINGHPYVDEEKRKEILAVMKEVDYIPNANARQLSYGKTKS